MGEGRPNCCLEQHWILSLNGSLAYLVKYPMFIVLCLLWYFLIIRCLVLLHVRHSHVLQEFGTMFHRCNIALVVLETLAIWMGSSYTLNHLIPKDLETFLEGVLALTLGILFKDRNYKTLKETLSMNLQMLNTRGGSTAGLGRVLCMTEIGKGLCKCYQHAWPYNFLPII